MVEQGEEWASWFSRAALGVSLRDVWPRYYVEKGGTAAQTCPSSAVTWWNLICHGTAPLCTLLSISQQLLSITDPAFMCPITRLTTTPTHVPASHSSKTWLCLQSRCLHNADILPFYCRSREQTIMPATPEWWNKQLTVHWHTLGWLTL